MTRPLLLPKKARPRGLGAMPDAPALRAYGMRLRTAPAEVREDAELVLAVVQENGLALRFAGAALRAVPEIAFAAVRENRFALHFVALELCEARMRQLCDAGGAACRSPGPRRLRSGAWCGSRRTRRKSTQLASGTGCRSKRGSAVASAPSRRSARTGPLSSAVGVTCPQRAWSARGL